MKKIIALVLALMLVLSLCACGSKTEAPKTDAPKTDAPKTDAPKTDAPKTDAPKTDAPKTDAPAAPTRDTLNVAVQYDYGSLDTISMTQYAFGSMICVMEPLWEVYKDGEIKLILADSYEWEADDHQVVHLKKGIKFSNGNPLTAEDVIFTLELLRDCGTAYGPQRVQTTDFERTKARDDYTIDWYLKEPSILHMTVNQQLFIYDKESYDPAKQAERPIGTGPYVVTDYVVNSHLTVERRDDYWGELPELKTITFRMLAEPSQRVNSLETGRVDCASVPLADVDHVSTLPNVQILPRDGSWIYLGFNISEDGLLGDPIAREAICHAIDRQAISNIVYYGKARVMNNPFTPGLMDYDPRWDGLGVYEKGYDLELAKQQAEESGLSGKTITLANNGSAEFIQISEMIQNMLSKIGVTCEIVAYDSATYSQIKNDKTKFDICVSNGVSGNFVVGDSFINSITRNKIYQIKENWEYGHADRYWEIMNQSLSNMNEKERADVCAELMQYYVETNPTFGLVEFDSYYAFPKDLDLTNYRLHLMDQPWCKDMHFN